MGLVTATTGGQIKPDWGHLQKPVVRVVRGTGGNMFWVKS